MKDSPKTKPNSEMARDLFTELSEGMKTLAEERLGKRTLKTTHCPPTPCLKNEK